jgi:hypothetical protein
MYDSSWEVRVASVFNSRQLSGLLAINDRERSRNSPTDQWG